MPCPSPAIQPDRYPGATTVVPDFLMCSGLPAAGWLYAAAVFALWVPLDKNESLFKTRE